MRLGLLLKMLLMEVIFVVKVTMNIETPKKTSFLAFLQICVPCFNP